MTDTSDMEKVGISEEQVMSVRDRPLEESYKDHDIGHDVVVARLEAHDFIVEDHGDDARHADEVFYGDGPDLSVYVEDDNGEKVLVGYIEVKCKTDPEWFGRCNLRHFKEYVNFSNEVDVPVFIWFALVERESPVIHREAFVEVEDTDQIDSDIVDITDDDVVFYRDDIKVVDDDGGLVTVAAEDIVNVRTHDETIVDYIPAVHGNEVIELNDDDFRSWPHFLHIVDA